MLKLTLAMATALGGLILPQSNALADVTLTLVDGAGAPVPPPFQWQLEEDNTDLTVPGVQANDSASLVIHKSHAPVLANGQVTAAIAPLTIPTDVTKRYVLSIMKDGYAVGGNTIAVGQNKVGVILNKHPLPTAQISILVFKDHNPINNVPDALETGLPGFHVVLADFLGGPIMADAFGNPLGTTYEYDPATGEPVTTVDGPVVKKMGTGQIYTDANGKALVKYLPMGKFGVQVIPPTGSVWMGGHATANVSGQWHQTATIEGTPTVDAWVGANEPMIFVEGFGPGTYHTFFGFVDPGQLPSGNPTTDPRTRIGLPTEPGNMTVKGVNRFNHFGRPSALGQPVFPGPAVSDAWVALNELNGGVAGAGLYAAPCDPATGEFVISNVPPGMYQLVSWDVPLDALFGINTIIVPAPAAGEVVGTCDLGSVFSSRWFGTLEGSFFQDADGDGFRDLGEVGIPQLALNIRWRDGTIYQSTVTDSTGDYALSEVFPFFKWLMLDSDYSRFKPTGLTAVVDEGGAIPADDGWNMPSEGVRNPQPQFELNADGTQTTTPIINPNTGNNLSRTEVGPVLTEAVHLFLNQNNRIDWGRQNYLPGENGGISGVIGYQTTRAEEDPRDGTNDPWEPGIPRVQVALYLRDATVALPADTLDTVADATSTRLLIKDVNASGAQELADVDNHPLGWATGGTAGPEDLKFNATTKAYQAAVPTDTYNSGDAVQIVWSDSWDDSPPTGTQQPNPPVILGKPILGSDNYATWNQIRPGVFDGGYAFGDYFPNGIPAAVFDADPSNDPAATALPAGEYVVQASPPAGYKIQTEESVNVVFGDAYVPSKLALAPPLTGDYHQVAAELTLFPDQHVAVTPAFAGKWRPYADRKFVKLSDGQNAACDFHMYTDVPKATRVVGFVLNDLTAEFNAKSPIFGEKGSPGWVPISIRDWANHEVAHVYSDEFGTYNALVPSTYNVAAPAPSGVSPNMLTIVLNDPTMADPTDPTGNKRIPDPHYNPNFATTPWTLQYYPGTLLYADTPIVPTAALVGYPNNQLDVEPAAGTPVIKRVSTSSGVGPYLSTAAGTITIESMGLTSVPNPAYVLGNVGDVPAMIQRDYGFGATQGSVTINGQSLSIVGWANDVITATLPTGWSGEGQLLVTSASGVKSPIGVTFTVGGTGTVRRVALAGADFTSIQAAVDAAANGDLILVETNDWAENVILNKPVRLQGAGAATVINANPVPFSRLATWHQKVASLLGGDPFTANEAPGVMVLGQYVQGPQATLQDSGFSPAVASRIDGFQIKGSIAGGGITVWHKVNSLRISNNRIAGNQGSFVGGIALGMNATLGTMYDNPNITIEWNQILKNGGVNGPGGIGIFSGATGYKIQNNQILGNFSRGSGGGIGHQGISPNGLIANNNISWNEVFYGAVGAAPALAPGMAAIPAGEGAGIFISGELAPGALSSGSGSVTILNNLLQGNLAGAGDGGGIRIVGVNGEDVAESTQATEWYAIDIINNVIVNNVSALAGGGISMSDATRVRIVNNTIANNDSSATALLAFSTVTANQSTPQIAGVASHQLGTDLRTLSGQAYVSPLLQNNIIYQNRSWYFDRLAVPAGLVARPEGLNWELGVVELPTAALSPANCLVGTDPAFIAPYLNTLFTAIVIDEAGNNINVRHTPIGPGGDYHISAASAARTGGATVTDPSVAFDFDQEARPALDGVTDIGADEFGSTAAIVTFATTAPEAGPGAGGNPPALVAAVGAGTPPGPMLAPVFEPMPADTDNVDTDGDGIRNNDNHYVHLTAGDGFMTMADGNELYCFGFSDVTELVSNKVAAAYAPGTTAAQREAILREVKPMVLDAGMLRANFAAPTLVFKQGQQVYLDLSNVGMLMRPDLFDPHTVHFHGFPQAASIFDGEPMSAISINMGGTLRYFYNIVEPGTYIYHCHVEATEHMEMGMIGNLWVEPKQNNAPTGAYPGHTRGVTKFAYNDGNGSTLYHVEVPIQLLGVDRNFHEQHIAVQPLPFWSLDESYPTINGRGYPDTVNPAPLPAPMGLAEMDPTWPSSQKVSALVTAQVGQKILLRISNVSVSDLHTVTVLGIPMRVVGKDARLLRGPNGRDLSYQTTSVTLGGGETADAILDTTGLTPGTYFIYDSRLNHLNNDQEEYGGMMTEIRLTP